MIDLFRAGEPLDTVTEEFGLSRCEVEDAIRVITKAAILGIAVGPGPYIYSVQTDRLSRLHL